MEGQDHTKPRRRRWRRLGYLPALPVILWVALVLLVPTERVRRRVEQALVESTGYDVTVGSLSLGWLGRVSALDVAVLGPGIDGTRPELLHATAAHLDANAMCLLTGRVQPQRIELAGLRVLVTRSSDGRLSSILDVVPRRKAVTNASPAREATDVEPIEFRITDGLIQFEDRKLENSLSLTNVEAWGNWEPGHTTLRIARGKLEGGTVELAGEWSAGPMARVDAEFRASRVEIRRPYDWMSYVVPVLPRSQARALTGTLDGQIAVRAARKPGRGWLDGLSGEGSIEIDPVCLDRSAILNELTRLVPLPEDNRLGTVRSTFRIGDRKIHCDPLLVKVDEMPLVLQGSTTFDGALSYRVRAEDLAGRLSSTARDFLSNLPMEPGDLISIRIGGTIQRPDLQIDGMSLLEDGEKGRDRLKKVSRQLWDRYFR